MWRVSTYLTVRVNEPTRLWLVRIRKEPSHKGSSTRAAASRDRLPANHGSWSYAMTTCSRTAPEAAAAAAAVAPPWSHTPRGPRRARATAVGQGVAAGPLTANNLDRQRKRKAANHDAADRREAVGCEMSGHQKAHEAPWRERHALRRRAGGREAAVAAGGHEEAARPLCDNCGVGLAFSRHRHVELEV